MALIKEAADTWNLLLEIAKGDHTLFRAGVQALIDKAEASRDPDDRLFGRWLRLRLALYTDKPPMIWPL